MSNPPLIAIVDDDEAVREAIADLLQVEGFATRTFDGAAAFLAAREDASFHCLISDVRMPEMDGLQLQQTLRARGSDLPMIFITSSEGTTRRPQAMEDGAIAWFTKPVADKELLGVLHAACAGDPRLSSDK